MGRPEYINDDDAVINLSEFKQSSNQRKIKINNTIRLLFDYKKINASTYLIIIIIFQF